MTGISFSDCCESTERLLVAWLQNRIFRNGYESEIEGTSLEQIIVAIVIFFREEDDFFFFTCSVPSIELRYDTTLVEILIIIWSGNRYIFEDVGGRGCPWWGRLSLSRSWVTVIARGYLDKVCKPRIGNFFFFCSKNVAVCRWLRCILALGKRGFLGCSKGLSQVNWIISVQSDTPIVFRKKEWTTILETLEANNRVVYANKQQHGLIRTKIAPSHSISYWGYPMCDQE